MKIDFKDKFEKFKFLLKSKSSLYTDFILLQDACAKGDIKTFLKRYNKYNPHLTHQECLRQAAWCSQTQMYIFLYDFFKCSTNEHLGSMLAQHFISAVARGNTELMEFMLSCDKSKFIASNINNNKLLEVAIDNVQSAAIDFLERNSLINYADMDKAIQKAKFKNIYPKIEKLILNHSLPDSPNSPNSPNSRGARQSMKI